MSSWDDEEDELVLCDDDNDDDDNDDESEESEDTSPSETLGELAASAFLLLAGAGIKSVGSALGESIRHTHQLELEKERAEQERIQRRKDSREAFFRRHWRTIFGLILVAILTLLGLYVFSYYQKLIPVGYSPDDLKGHSQDQVTFLLSEAGYTDITVEELFDLSLQNEDQAGIVAQVSIDDSCTFTESDRFPYDSDVVVYVHSLKLVSPPFSHKEVRKSDYATVLSQLKTAGFVAIESEPIYDVVLGWFAKDGDIESITIGGSTEFDSSVTFRPDAEVIITYHTLKKNADSGSQ